MRAREVDIPNASEASGIGPAEGESTNHSIRKSVRVSSTPEIP